MQLRLLMIIVVSAVVQIDGARILFVGMAPSLSHHLFYQPIIRELCARGHEVVSISPDPINQPVRNLKEIDIHNETYGAINVGDYLMYNQQVKPRLTTQFKRFGPLGLMMMANILGKPEIRALESDKFDLIILEYFMSSILNGLKDHYNCPLIGIASADLMVVGADGLGNPTFPSYYVDMNKPSGSHLGFYQRLENFAYTLDMRWWWYWEGMNHGKELFKKIYNKDLDMVKMQSNMDLVLINSNPIFNEPRPMVPSLIPIGGLHQRTRKPLPQVSNMNQS